MTKNQPKTQDTMHKQQNMSKKAKRSPKTGTSPAAIKALQREGEAVKMRMEGYKLQDIANRLGYKHRAGARQALMRAISRLSPLENIEALHNAEVQKTYEVEQEAWEGWDRSIEDAIKVVTKETSIDARESEESRKPTGNRIQKEFIRTVTSQSGNPSFLDKILKAMERRAKLLGLDAPTKIESNEDNGAWRLLGRTPAEYFQDLAKRLEEDGADES
jgi:hypothetical protein